MALTGKKKAFADAKLAGKSNKEAAIAAGYSEKTAAAAGARLVKDVNIAAYLAAAKASPGKKDKAGEQPPSDALTHSDPMAFLRSIMNDPGLPILVGQRPKRIQSSGSKIHKPFQ